MLLPQYYHKENQWLTLPERKTLAKNTTQLWRKRLRQSLKRFASGLISSKGDIFLLTTDQRSIAFMFDRKSKGKIKNSKLLSWRLELSQFSYDLRHKPGANHVAPDALSRICSVATTKQIDDLHK